MGARSIVVLLGVLAPIASGWALAHGGSARETPSRVQLPPVAEASQEREPTPSDGVPKAWRAAGWDDWWPGPPTDVASWHRVRGDLSQANGGAPRARRRAAAAYVLRFVGRDDRAATDAPLALDLLLGVAAGADGPDAEIARVAGADAIGRALFVARADSERASTWVRAWSEAAAATPAITFEGVEPASLARLVRARLDLARGEHALALDSLFEAAREGDALARAARGAAFELLRDTVEARTRRWLDAWAAREEAVDEPPERAAWPRMAELADLGEGRATWWCWMRVDALDAAPKEREQRRAELTRRLVERHGSGGHGLGNQDPGHDGESLARTVARDAMASAKPSTRAALLDLLTELGDGARRPDDRAWCLWARAHLEAAVEPRNPDAAIALLERLRREAPSSDLARSAGPWIFALRHLRVGRELPDFERPDALGRTVDLEARRGRVLALVFLEDSPRGRSLLSVFDQLGLLYPRSRFEVVIVNVDPDVDAARERYAASGREWEVSWQGSRNSPWPVTWNVKTFPSVFLVDAEGVVRARDVFGAELTSKVLELLGG